MLHGVSQLVTIWNRVKEPDRDIFYRYLLPVLCKYKTNVHRDIGMNRGGGSRQISSNTEAISLLNTQMIIVPYTADYHPANTWTPGTGFTFKTGDIMALGDHDIEITGIQPYREVDVITRIKPHVMYIKTIEDHTRDVLGRHWRIQGI